METPEEDPGIVEDLKVRRDAPPETQILTAHDQENLMRPEFKAENSVGLAEEKTKDDLEGLENTAACDRNPGEGIGDGVQLTTMPTSLVATQLSREEKEPEKDCGCEESLAVSGEKIEAGKSSSLVAEDIGIEVAAPSSVAHDCDVLEEKDVSEEMKLPAVFNVSTPSENAPQPDSVLLEISSESEIGPAPETAPAPEIPPDLKSSLITIPSEEVKKLWEDGMKSQNVSKLLKIVRETTSDVVELEKAGDRRGRTALHIAAKSDDAESFTLAKAILDQLLKFQQELYTDKVFETYRKKGFFCTIGDYIRAVETASRKTAMELAKESIHQNIVEYIKDIQKRSAAHAKIDRDVAIFGELRDDYDEDLIESEDSAEREEFKTWLRKAITSRDCTLLMEVVEKLLSQPTENPWEDEYWKCEGESARTMLHVAAMQGCFPLAKRLLDRARIRNDRDYVEVVDGLSGLTALQMANDIIGNRSIAEYVTYTLERMKKEDYVHSCFREVYPRTYWFWVTSRKYFDKCEFLRVNPCLLLETHGGCTVLHTAILHNDHEIMEMVLQLFGRNRKITFGESYFPSVLTWKDMCNAVVKIPGSLIDVTGLHTLFSDATESSPFTSPFEGTVMQLIEHMNLDSSEEVASMFKKYYMESVVSIASLEESFAPLEEPSALSEESSIFSAIKSTINEKWKKEWDKGYAADVDFNFEAEPRLTLLKLHYVCKHFLIFREFFNSFASTVDEYGAEMWSLYDAQGRTIFHVLLDYCDNEEHYPSRWLFNEIFKDYDERLLKYFRDARGRSLSDILLTKNYLQHNILLENNKALHYDFNLSKRSKELDDDLNEVFKIVDYNPMNNNDYIVCFNFYHLATALKQINVAQHIWSNILEKNPKQLKELCKLKELAYIATSTGNQVMLRYLMENLIDLTITDAKGRNLLHHAANPSLLEFDALLKCPLMGQCFSTVQDLCEVKKKWNMERKKTSMIIPSRESDEEFDVEKLVTCVNMECIACILLLLQEGVDLSQEDEDKKVPNIGPTDDTTYQKSWYDMVVKDSIDKKNSFNQAASALSVVGTLVAATSYIGPLQPPMTFTDDGFLRTYVLIKVFMMSNTFAFYLAMTSVIFAVVPSLPMPQESARMELKRAQHIVSVSLHILLMSIISIIVSFGAASMVVMQDQDLYPGSDLLFFPSIIGCIFCLIAIVSFLIRVMRLTFPSSPTIRHLYQFRLTKSCNDAFQFMKSCKDAWLNRLSYHKT